MNKLAKLSREVQVVLAGGVLYLFFSFLDWQQVSGLGITVGANEWHGVGVVSGLLVIALLIWETARLMGMKVDFGSITPGLVSVALALMLLVFTIITFLSHSTARNWPAWIGLILSVAIATAALKRAKAEEVQSVAKLTT